MGVAFNLHWFNKQTGGRGVTKMHMQPGETTDKIKERFLKLFPACQVVKLKLTSDDKEVIHGEVDVAGTVTGRL